MEDTIDNNNNEPIFKNLTIGTSIIITITIFVHIASYLQIGGDGWVINSIFISKEFAKSMSFFHKFWPLIGYQFLHGSLLHLGTNMMMLLQAGPIAEIGFMKNANIYNYSILSRSNSINTEKRIAAVKFIIFYILCGIFGALGFYVLNLNSQNLLIGGSGSISGTFAAFLMSAIMMSPQSKELIRPLFVSGIIFLILNVVLAAIGRQANLVSIAWETHLFGFIAGLILFPILKKL